MTFRAQDEVDPRIDRDPSEPDQPPPVEDPGSRVPDDPVDVPPAPPTGDEPERRDPSPGEPAWRDPGGGPAQEV